MVIADVIGAIAFFKSVSLMAFLTAGFETGLLTKALGFWAGW